MLLYKDIKIKMKEKNSKNKFRLTNEQVDKLKIIETLESFQTGVANFRKKFLMNVPKGSFDLKSLKLTVFELANKIEEDLHIMGEKFNLPYSLMRSQVIFYIKHNQWGFDTSCPKEFYEPSLMTPVNYRVRNEPRAIGDGNGKIIKYSKTVSLITYARLSTKEEKMAIKELRQDQKRYLDPILTKQVRQKKNIERDIAVEKEMATRKPSEEKITGYLKLAKKEYEKGLKTTEKFNKIKKLHPNDVEIIKSKTSKDIARNILGNKKHADNARQIVSRIKKKKEKMFGNL